MNQVQTLLCSTRSKSGLVTLGHVAPSLCYTTELPTVPRTILYTIHARYRSGKKFAKTIGTYAPMQSNSNKLAGSGALIRPGIRVSTSYLFSPWAGGNYNKWITHVSTTIQCCDCVCVCLLACLLDLLISCFLACLFVCLIG